MLRVILNPAAASGAAARRRARIEMALKARGLDPEVVLTEGPGDAARLVREARRDGASCVAVVGGDGTLNDACQGYLDETGELVAGPDLAVIPSGTGGDFRRTFGFSEEPEAAAERISRGAHRAIDLGRLRLVAPDGRTVVKAFLNITSFGLGGLTDRIVNQSPKWLGGKATFLIGALRATLAYRSAPVRLKVDGEVRLEAAILNVAIANGQYFGGGMMVAPDADPSDGQFDVVAMYDLTRAQGIALAQHIYKGSHVGRPGVQVARGRRIEAEALSPSSEVLIDMDGETPGRLPLTAEVLPGALRLRV